MKFSQLGLAAPILKALEEQGYSAPSPIQEKAIPPALKGRDVLGCAQTGTGKTCAFATPILQRLSAAAVKGRPIRALILTPTRELALQIQESFEAYGRHLPLRSAVIFGGVGQNPQVEQLKRGVEILVATPGRLLDLHGQGLVDLTRLEIFVLDEADRMLDMGFIHDVRRVLKVLPAKKQTLFFSATMPPEVTELVDSLLHDPVRVAVDPISSPVEVIDQKLYRVDKGNKTKLLASLLTDPEVKNALVFTRTKHGANKVAGDLNKAGIAAAAIHGNKSQTARQQALADFKAGRVKVLVATDIAARGLDIEELSHVFNYNLPDVPETYVHRIGRTGRAGRGGTAISFCDFGEEGYLKDIHKLLGREIPQVDGHPWPMEVFEAAAKDAKGRPVNADDQEARQAARERKRARAAEKIAEKGEKTRQKPEKIQQKPAEIPAAAAAPEEGKKKSRRRKKKAAVPVQEAAPAPAPVPEEPARSKRGVRHNRLEDTAPRLTDSAAVRTEFRRPDPLSFDCVMDATARLLAPRPLTLSRPKAESAPEKKPAEEKRAAPEQKANPRRKKKAAIPEEKKETAVPKKAEEPAAAGKKHRRRGKGGDAPAPQPAPQVETAAPKKKKRRSNRVPSGPELRLGNQKDSTEQPSLMKPYYINYDD